MAPTANESPVDPSVVDICRLTKWMDARGLGSGPVLNAAPLAGGTQNLLLRFSRADRARADRTYVLRWPPEHKRKNSDETMRREARVLGALAGSDVPHPGLIAAEPDESVLGAAFYLMESIDGYTPTSGLTEPHRANAAARHAMGFSFADAAAALGRVDYQAVGLADFGKPEGYLERQVPRWQRQLDSYAELGGSWQNEIPGVAAVAAWLDTNRPATFDAGVIHGDFHLGNVMFDRDRPEVAAVVDWELATIGDPLIDLGTIIAFWPSQEGLSLMSVQPWDGFPTVDEMISRYAEGSARDVSASAWYGVLACYKTGIILEGTHARAQAGQASTAIGDTLHTAALQLFRRAHELIHTS